MLSFWESKLSQTFSYCSLKLTFSIYDFIDSGARIEESEKQGVEWNDDASGSQGETKAKFSSDQLPYKWHQTKINKFPKTASYLTKYSSNRLAEKDDVLGLVSRLIKETPIVD